MQHLPRQTVGPDAQLFVNHLGQAILFLRRVPVDNGDVVITDAIESVPVWRPLELRPTVRGPRLYVLECRDPNARRHLVLHFDGNVVRIHDIKHKPQPIRERTITVLPFPAQRLLSRVLENATTGNRIAYYVDPNVPASRAAWIRVGQRARPTDWRWHDVTGISRDGQVVETRVGTLDLQAGLWRGQLMEDLPLRAHGVPQEDEWGVPLRRAADPDSMRALLALGGLIVGLVLGLVIGFLLDGVA